MIQWVEGVCVDESWPLGLVMTVEGVWDAVVVVSGRKLNDDEDESG